MLSFILKTVESCVCFLKAVRCRCIPKGYICVMAFTFFWFMALFNVSADALGHQSSASNTNVSTEDLGAHTIPTIHTRKIKINYNIESVPKGDLVRIELWYSLSPKQPWIIYDYDEDLTSPVFFTASQEGIHRFLIVAVDKWGRRSYTIDDRNAQTTTNPIPPLSIPAQLTVYVDYTKPKLFLYHPRNDISNFKGTEIPIRWNGFDTNLGPKPVALYYKSQSDNYWTPIVTSQAANGRYRWAVPEKLYGAILIRVVLTDLSKNQTYQDSGLITIVKGHDDTPSITPLQKRVAAPVKGKGKVVQAVNDIHLSGKSIVATSKTYMSPIGVSVNDWDLVAKNRLRASRASFDTGLMHSKEHQWDDAMVAFSKALALDATFSAANINLGNVYYAQGKFNEALKCYTTVLQTEPHQKKALFGLGQTQLALKEYDKSIKTLAYLLKLDQNDWEVWLLHGDNAKEIGDMPLAMRSWQKAANGDATEVKITATERIAKFQ